VIYIGAAAGVLWGSVSYRTMLYVPSFASGVATIILWQQIFNPYHGMANNILGQIFQWMNLDVTLPTWLNSTKSLLGSCRCRPRSAMAGSDWVHARRS
jgi:ABC-type sugar transport system permease subunit